MSKQKDSKSESTNSDNQLTISPHVLASHSSLTSKQKSNYEYPPLSWYLEGLELRSTTQRIRKPGRYQTSWQKNMKCKSTSIPTSVILSRIPKPDDDTGVGSRRRPTRLRKFTLSMEARKQGRKAFRSSLKRIPAENKEWSRATLFYFNLNIHTRFTLVRATTTHKPTPLETQINELCNNNRVCV